MNIISARSREIIKLLEDIEKYPAASTFKQEMMGFSYVLVCGSIEIMTETILGEWLSKTIKHHKRSSYPGREYVQYFLTVQFQAREKNIQDFHSTDLDMIRGLIKNIAGVKAMNKFNKLLQLSQQTQSIQPDINARLDRISRIRHELAHGQKMPNDIQPNISELRDDFIFIYSHVITNIKKCLPKV